MKNLKEVSDKVKAFKGVSFKPFNIDTKGNLSTPKSGYMVATYGNDAKLDFNKKTVEIDIADYIFLTSSELENNHNLFVGVWVDNGDIYFDTSVNITDLKAALYAGYANKQRAIYDVSNNKTIYLPQPQKGGTETQKQVYIKYKIDAYLKHNTFFPVRVH